MLHPLSEPAYETPYRGPTPPAQPPPARGRGAVGAAALGVGVLLFKFAKFIFIPLKFLGLGKFWVTGLSMLAMVWSYAMFHGWLFAVGLVVLIFIHEMGHAFEIKRAGLGSSWPVFIPFMGAFITLKGAVLDVHTEARIGIAGPVAGAAASLGCVLIYQATGSTLFLALGYVGFFLNLFNMLPMRPLDGGRVFAAISRKASPWGLGIVALAMFFTGSPMLIFIAIMGFMSWMSQRNMPPEAAERYHSIPDRLRLAWAGAYFGLVLALGLGMAYTFGAAS